MPMSEDPEEINATDRYLESVILKEGRVYADRNERSKEENKGRADSRETIKKAGIRTDAYALAVKHTKDLNAREREDYMRDYKLVLKILTQKQKELFPEEAMKAAKREDDRKRKEAEAKTKAGPDADTNPRSNPDKGGAKPQLKVVGTEPGDMKNRPGTSAALTEASAASDAAIAESLAAISGGGAPNPPEEEAEGAAALDAAMPKTKKAQSKIAADIAAAAGTDKPLH